MTGGLLQMVAFMLVCLAFGDGWQMCKCVGNAATAIPPFFHFELPIVKQLLALPGLCPAPGEVGMGQN